MEHKLKKLVKFQAKRDEDFDLWCTRVQAYLLSRGFMEFVSDDCSSVTEERETVIKKIATARSVIIQALGDNPLRTVMAKKTNLFIMWRKLCESYATATATTRVQVQTRLHQMDYSSAKSLSEYIDEMEGIFNRL